MLKLPYSLRIPDSPEVKIILVNGSHLYFLIGKEDKATIHIGNLDLLAYSKNFFSPKNLKILSNAGFPIERTESFPNGARIAFFELSLSQVAKNVPLI